MKQRSGLHLKPKDLNKETAPKQLLSHVNPTWVWIWGKFKPWISTGQSPTWVQKSTEVRPWRQSVFFCLSLLFCACQTHFWILKESLIHYITTIPTKGTERRLTPVPCSLHTESKSLLPPQTPRGPAQLLNITYNIVVPKLLSESRGVGIDSAATPGPVLYKGSTRLWAGLCRSHRKNKTTVIMQQ